MPLKDLNNTYEGLNKVHGNEYYGKNYMEEVIKLLLIHFPQTF